MALGNETYNANLPNGDLDEFLSDINQEKTSYSQDEEEGLNDLFGDQTSNSDCDFDGTQSDGEVTDQLEGDDKISFNPEMASLSADFAAMMTDLALPSLIALFVKCDPEKLQATQEQYDKLVKAYTQYLETKQIQMTPGWMLVGVIASIYATKIPAAIRERKLKEREDELNAREKEFEERVRKFETENEVTDDNGSAE